MAGLESSKDSLKELPTIYKKEKGIKKTANLDLQFLSSDNSPKYDMKKKTKEELSLERLLKGDKKNARNK